ncbi:GNAT family N-acetyltransferase [Aneurinibacillus sp. Ricciae_BoGa-3]|uniref:GNAT family N-acetyltransferase n=1 Tax=Aneurinibacillus sp. Ricciae_BoGa-3 TaxID=3022697 RepID=UPI002341E82B|nr:GNAT family N-acetyltransferase [Aneurinibacillus sp. Ricciae_BoGa-3]WCK56118.1 GNAT family N-acetyltransferase [Aneurinibacillus sp. Ricciae_BoGa-3]
MSEIKKGNSSFFIEDKGEKVAEIHYVPNEAGFEVDSTHVSNALSGQGVGESLVRRMVEFARDQHKKIVATCPFAKAQIEKHPELQDVLAK